VAVAFHAAAANMKVTSRQSQASTPYSAASW
jgi:hypothetical protein